MESLKTNDIDQVTEFVRSASAIVNRSYDEEIADDDDDDDSWRREIAHQAGMMGGIDAYNDTLYSMGCDDDSMGCDDGHCDGCQWCD